MLTFWYTVDKMEREYIDWQEEFYSFYLMKKKEELRHHYLIQRSHPAWGVGADFSLEMMVVVTVAPK